MSTQKTLTVLLGAGPGTGAALGHAFAKETGAVALLARRPDSLQALAREIREKGGVAEPFACDASNPESLTKAFGQIKEKWPDHQLKVAIFSVNNPFVRKPFLELTTKDMQTGLDIAVLGAFHFSQQVIPLLLEAGGGTLLFSGATAALKGGAQMSSFAVPKFGLRCLSQSLAREFQPKDIHVAHVILDGFINTENLTRMFGEMKAPDTRMEPTAIAQEYVNLHRQHRSIGYTTVFFFIIPLLRIKAWTLGVKCSKGDLDWIRAIYCCLVIAVRRPFLIQNEKIVPPYADRDEQFQA